MTTQFDPSTIGYQPNGHRPSASASGPPVPPAMQGAGRSGERLPRVRRPRRPGLTAAGVLLVLLCGVTGAAVATAGQQKVSVLTLARDVQAGHVLTTEDLKVSTVSGEGVSALGGSGASAVVGQTVTATLSAGTLLNPSMVTVTPLPGEGLVVVAVAVKPGGAPAQAVPGRDVSIIRVTTTADAKTSQPAVLVPKARIVSAGTETSSGLQILSLQVPTAAAVAVSQASAAGAVAVVLLPVTP